MTAVKTVIGALEEARDVLLQRVSGLTALQTQRAIEELVAQIAAVSASAAPKTAEYLVAATDATLTAERVATNTATITWDFATAGQAKANLAITPVVGSLGAVDNTVIRTDGTGGSTAQGSLVTIGDTGIMNGAIAVGVNATADTTNRLSVNSAAVLFNHNGTTSQVKVNKAATGNTASHLFQVGFSGRAEFGLIGTDDFTLKTSPDGSAFTTALTALNASGALRVGVNLSPTANDGAALGTTALQWSDAFWASGAVLNFNNGNVTITQGSGSLTYSGTAGLTQTHLYTGADGTTVFGIDAGGSSLNNSSAFTVTVPTTGAQKGFQVTTPGATASWVSCELAIGGAGKPGFILGPGSAVRDTNLYRDSADTWKTDDALIVTGTLTASGTIELGNASDTTLARASAGDVNVEGNRIYRAGGTDVPVADGGTGVSSLTAYAVVCGGTTSTNPVQSIASVGTSGQVLTSNGAAALPTFQAPVGGGLTLLTSGTVSAAATLDIVLTSYTAYRAIKFVLESFVPSIDDSELQMLFSTNGGSSYNTGGSDYAWVNQRSRSGSGSPVSDVQSSDAKITFAGIPSANFSPSNVASEGGVNAEIMLFDQTVAGFTAVSYASTYYAANTESIDIRGSARRLTAQDTDAVRFLFKTASNITSGKYAVYGVS